MTGIRFEWDEAKNRSNQRKHGVSFEVAAQLFQDPLQLSVQDRTENGEQRWQTFGSVSTLGILLVAHTIKEQDFAGRFLEIIRIISARRATRKERQRYESENG